MLEILSEVNNQLIKIGLNYEYGLMSKCPPKYPYWVGDYMESGATTEDGIENVTIILAGFARGDFISFEKEKEKIKEHFLHGITVFTAADEAIIIFYDGTTNLPEEQDLKRCQINLSIKLWKGK